MTNKEFIEKSKQRVTQLNGSTTNISYQAWRDGYNYAVQEVYKMMEEAEGNSDFIDKITDFSNQELEVFEWNV